MASVKSSTNTPRLAVRGLAGGLLLVALACGPLKQRSPSPRGRPDLPALQRVTMQSSGVERSFFLAVPNTLPPGPRPLVIVAHGGASEGDSKGRAMAIPWIDHADEGILYAFPNSAYDSVRPWFGPEDDTPLKDVRFLADIVARVGRKHPVDPDQVYLGGFSAGAGLAWWVYCNDASRYAGFGMVSAQMAKMLMPTCEPAAERPVFYMHGADDPVIPMSGNADHDASDATVAWLRERYACAAVPKRDRISGSSGTAVGATYTCKGPGAVSAWTLRDTGHCWPSVRGRCAGLDGSGLMLDFWRASAGLPE